MDSAVCAQVDHSQHMGVAMKNWALLYLGTALALGLYGCGGQTIPLKPIISSEMPLSQTLQSAAKLTSHLTLYNPLA